MREARVLHLLPTVCRDCGKSTKEARLSPYLDFHLCSACIARREREVMRGDKARAVPAAKTKTVKKKVVKKTRKPRR